MRTLRLCLVGAVILALVGGLSGAVLAQTSEEESLDPWRPSHFTRSWTDDWQDDVAGWEWMHRGTHSESLDNEAVHAFEASDTRINGAWTHVLAIGTFPIDVENGHLRPGVVGHRPHRERGWRLERDIPVAVHARSRLMPTPLRPHGRLPATPLDLRSGWLRLALPRHLPGAPASPAASVT